MLQSTLSRRCGARHTGMNFCKRMRFIFLFQLAVGEPPTKSERRLLNRPAPVYSSRIQARSNIPRLLAQDKKTAAYWSGIAKHPCRQPPVLRPSVQERRGNHTVGTLASPDQLHSTFFLFESRPCSWPLAVPPSSSGSSCETSMLSESAP
jgi:hypothetical protein